MEILINNKQVKPVNTERGNMKSVTQNPTKLCR